MKCLRSPGWSHQSNAKYNVTGEASQGVLVYSWWKLGCVPGKPSILPLSSSSCFHCPAILTCGWVDYFQCKLDSHSPKSALQVKPFGLCCLIIFLHGTPWHRGVFAKLNWNQQVIVWPALVRTDLRGITLEDLDCLLACTQIFKANCF